MIEHDDAVARVSKEFERKGFRVHTSLNNLPTNATRSEAIYRPTYVRNPKDGQIVWIVEFLSVNEMTDHAFAIVDLPVALSSGIVLIHVKVGSPSYETVVHEVWQ